MTSDLNSCCLHIMLEYLCLCLHLAAYYLHYSESKWFKNKFNMTAGAVAVPTIVPLRPPHPGKHKTAVDSSTKIELKSGIVLLSLSADYENILFVLL